MLRFAGFLRVAFFQSGIEEGPDQDCWRCNGDCRLTLQRLQRLLGMPRKQIIPRFSKSPRLSPQIALLTDNAGREWLIACWDWKKWRDCRPRLPGLHRLPPKNTQIAPVAGIDENTEIADRDCQDFERECLPRSPANIVKTAEIAKSVSQDCRGYRNCRPRVGNCKLRLKKLTRLPDGFAWTAETAAKKCRDWRGCWECRIFSPSLPKVLTKIVETAMQIARRHCRDCRD